MGDASSSDSPMEQTGFELSVPSRGSWRRLIDGGDDLRCHVLDALISAPAMVVRIIAVKSPLGSLAAGGARVLGLAVGAPKIADGAIIGDIALRGGVNSARIWQSSDGTPPP
jgi:hypothetical protein